jgi:hypothetical protein
MEVASRLASEAIVVVYHSRFMLFTGRSQISIKRIAFLERNGAALPVSMCRQLSLASENVASTVIVI